MCVRQKLGVFGPRLCIGGRKQPTDFAVLGFCCVVVTPGRSGRRIVIAALVASRPVNRLPLHSRFKRRGEETSRAVDRYHLGTAPAAAPRLPLMAFQYSAAVIFHKPV